MAIKKVSSTPAPAPKASVAANTKVVFEPLPGSAAAVSGSSAKRLYVNYQGKEHRVNQCTLHKGTPDEVSFPFINIWDDQHSVQLTNPTISQVREAQSMYTRVRGFNIVRFGNKLTVYRMQPLSPEELATAYEK